MEPACLRHTELPHTSRLFSDFLYRYHKVERFYTTPPLSVYPEERRPALIEALREQNGDTSALRRLAEPRTVAVVTGQQVGLFSGPAYTIYKALTAAKIAEQLNATGVPAVPVFWLATEDHDFPEVAHASFFDRDHRPVRLQIDPPRKDGQPVGSVAVPEWPLSELRELLQNFDFGDTVSTLVSETYIAGATMGEAFQALLQRLLEPYGFVFVDPLHSSIRQLAAPVLRDAFAMAPDLHNLLLQRNRALEAEGYHAQVHIDQRTSLFFVIENGRRTSLRDSKRPPEQLAEEAHLLSPNALLRPVVQDYLLPTTAYVGGPAEVAYFAQSQVLYERLLRRMPRVVSRSGFTLIDSRTAKAMERYKLRLQDFFPGEESLRERIASTLLPAQLDEQFTAVQAGVSKLLADLGSSVLRLDPTLEAALGKSTSKIQHQLTKIQAKAARETFRRNDRASADAAYLYGSLFPQKHLQERLYSILSLLAQHGPELISTVYENIRVDCPDHILLPIS